MRLGKFLAHAGVASRRHSEELIAAGRVTVDGVTVVDPARAVAPDHDVAVDGRRVAPEATVVYALNKPAGVVSTARDTHGRPTVTQLVPSSARLYPIGRLDADATGLILLTNDGELANRLTHPRYEVPRIYRVRVARAPVRASALQALSDGVQLDDGRTAPASARRLAPNTIELTIHEGRKHQIKRMCDAVGHRAISLQRVGFGPLRLGHLREGAHRRLSAAEVGALRRAPGDSPPASGAGGRAARGAPKKSP
jgi:23S rRNA pseudouridine2605 synthase